MRTFLFLAVLTAIGCKDPGTKVDDTGDTDTGEDTDSGDTDSGDTDSGDTDSGDTDSGDTDTGEDTAAECWVPADVGECWECEPPTTPSEGYLEFLNACTDVDYALFDNATRIPASTWQEGEPLPEVD